MNAMLFDSPRENLVESEVSLCERCRALNLEKILGRAVRDVLGVPVADLGEIGEESGSATCGLCQLFAVSKPEVQDRDCECDSSEESEEGDDEHDSDESSEPEHNDQPESGSTRSLIYSQRSDGLPVNHILETAQSGTKRNYKEFHDDGDSESTETVSKPEHNSLHATESEANGGIKTRAELLCDATKFHLRAFRSDTMLGLEQTKGHKKASAVLAIGLGSANDRYCKHKLSKTTNAGFIVSTSTIGMGKSRLVAVKGALTDPMSIDYDKIKTWIADCQEHHTATCSNSAGVRPRLALAKVIDCATEHVISLEPSMEYIALSYVLGPRDDSNRKSKVYRDGTSLICQRPLPQVVADAIKAVTGLGYQYLWVDQYCINQEDDAEKALQLQSMHRIYEDATATIVAAYGDNANMGLPGVGSISRSIQCTARHDSLLLASTFPNLEHFLTSSAWSTRGWTLQEGILSRRLLFFTKAQVYFACRSVVCGESVDLHLASFSNRFREEIPLLRPKRESLATTGLKRMPDAQAALNLTRFYIHLNDYRRQRTLTYQSDALNAFRGILANCDFHSYWGIPLYADYEQRFVPWNAIQLQVNRPMQMRNPSIAFATGLAWRRLNPPQRPGKEPAVTRTLEFPTWSWASMPTSVISYVESVRDLQNVGHEEYHRIQGNADLVNATFYLERGRHGPINILFGLSTLPTKKVLPEVHKQIVIKSNVWTFSDFSPEFWSKVIVNKQYAMNVSYSVPMVLELDEHRLSVKGLVEKYGISNLFAVELFSDLDYGEVMMLLVAKSGGVTKRIGRAIRGCYRKCVDPGVEARRMRVAVE